MKSLTECIKESLLLESKFNVNADLEKNQTDYIKIEVIDKNFDLIDEVGFVLIEDLGNKPSNEKTWLPELGKYIGKNHGLSNGDSLSIQYWDENEEDWVQFAAVDRNGNIKLWDPDALEGKHPFE